MNKTKKVIIIVAVVIALLWVGYAFRVDRFGLGYQIDYVDYVYINNQLYISGLSPVQREPVDVSMIDQKIGEVKFTTLDNVHSPWYIRRNGDAAFLDKGTAIFSLKSPDNAVAVKVDDTYYIFRAD